MSRRSRRSEAPGALPLGVPIPIATGSARLEADPDGGVLLRVNGVPSSHHSPDPAQLEFEYLRWALTVIEEAAPRGRLRTVHLGGAGCSLARALVAVRPGSRNLAVELDAVLAERVREWFDLPRSPALRIRVAEARTTLDTLGSGTAEVIVRDVFAGDETPRPLTTVEALRRAREVLAPGGTWIANVADRPPLDLVAREVRTAREVFEHVAVAASPQVLKGRRYGNLLVLAGDAALPAGLDRRLLSDPAPAHLLRGRALDRIAARGAVLVDPAEPGDPAPPAGPAQSSGTTCSA